MCWRGGWQGAGRLRGQGGGWSGWLRAGGRRG